MNTNDKVKKISEFVFEIEFCSKLLKIIEGDDQDCASYKVHHSLMINNNVNVLSCEGEGLIFIVFQHVSSSDYIYFPELDVFEFNCHVNKDIAQSSVKKYFDLVGSNPSFNQINNKKLGGIIASHGRPSHFFYDTVLGMQLLYEEGFFKNTQKIYQIEGADFFDFKGLYSNDDLIKSVITDFSKLNEIAITEELLFVKVGSFSGSSNERTRDILERFDERFRLFSKTVDSDIISRIKTLKEQGCFILWHGITTDKRRWVEQVEAIVLLTQELKRLNYKVCLLVDGWTSPANKTSMDVHQIKEDREIFNQIQVKLDQNVECFSLIGETPVIKLAIADLIDFHISNGATGSIYTSRMAKKNGVLHISNSFRSLTKKLAIHHNSSFVPSSLVKDIPSLLANSGDHDSYSIKPELFSGFVMHHLSPETAPSVFIEDTVNCEVLNSSSYAFKSVNNDPMILLGFFNYLSKPGDELLFNFEIERNVEDKDALAKFYFDFGSGFNEKDMLAVRYDGNFLSTSFTIPHELKVLRFDPFDCLGEFTINKMDLKIVQS